MSEPLWRVLSSRYALSNRWLRVREDRCLTSGGVEVDAYYVIERYDFAMVVALTTDDEAVLVRQYKHGAGRVVVECPAGYIAAGEQPAAAAARELAEETGYQATDLTPLGVLYASPSTSTHRMHLFLAQNLGEGGRQRLDEAEEIEVVRLPFAEVLAKLRANQLVVDAASVAALSLAAAKLGR